MSGCGLTRIDPIIASDRGCRGAQRLRAYARSATTTTAAPTTRPAISREDSGVSAERARNTPTTTMIATAMTVASNPLRDPRGGTAGLYFASAVAVPHR